MPVPDEPGHGPFALTASFLFRAFPRLPVCPFACFPPRPNPSPNEERPRQHHQNSARLLSSTWHSIHDNPKCGAITDGIAGASCRCGLTFFFPREKQRQIDSESRGANGPNASVVRRGKGGGKNDDIHLPLWTSPESRLHGSPGCARRWSPVPLHRQWMPCQPRPQQTTRSLSHAGHPPPTLSTRAMASLSRAWPHADNIASCQAPGPHSPTYPAVAIGGRRLVRAWALRGQHSRHLSPLTLRRRVVLVQHPPWTGFSSRYHDPTGRPYGVMNCFPVEPFSSNSAAAIDSSGAVVDKSCQSGMLGPASEADYSGPCRSRGSAGPKLGGRASKGGHDGGREGFLSPS